MCNYISEVPFEGYAEVYLHKYTTPWGKDVEEICLGKPYKGEEDKPLWLEYDNAAYKHLGTVNITITSDDPKINGLKVDSSRINKAEDIDSSPKNLSCGLSDDDMEQICKSLDRIKEKMTKTNYKLNKNKDLC